MRKAVCLLSGGLDSAVTLYAVQRAGYDPAALTVVYGQRHVREVECARQLAAGMGIRHEVVEVPMPWGGSALLDAGAPMPGGRSESEMGQAIPSTYVPARNTIFLALAVSFAEATGAGTVFYGANALDYSGYPDCRPEYVAAFRNLVELGTRSGAEKKPVGVEAPLVHMSKKDIVELGHELKVPFEKTWSCYQGGEQPCGECDSCRLRAKGFREAGLKDPAIDYAASTHR